MVVMRDYSFFGKFIWLITYLESQSSLVFNEKKAFLEFKFFGDVIVVDWCANAGLKKIQYTFFW